MYKIKTEIKKLERENYKLNLIIGKFKKLDRKFYLFETKFKKILKYDTDRFHSNISTLNMLESKLNRIQFEYRKLENECGDISIYQMKKLVKLNNKKIYQLYSKLKDNF